MITIYDILNDKKFSNLILLNKEADLSRKVSTVESTETPDVTDFLSPNAFLITTGMVYKDNQEELKNLIVKLNSLPCAGLGIKLGRFIDELDNEVVELANELKFPIIQIPMEITLGNIFQKLLSHIWDNQNEQLLFSLNLQRKFSELMVKNSSLDILIENLSWTLKQDIALVDPFGNIINTSSKIKNKYSKKILREIVEKISSSDNNNKDSIKIHLKANSNISNMVYINPIKMASYYPYYLIIFDAENMEYPLSTFAIEQALLILAFTLYKNLRISYGLLSSKEEFFEDLISPQHRNGLSESQLLFKGERYNLKASKYYQIIVASQINENKFKHDTSELEESYSLVFNWIEEKLSKDLKDTILFPSRKENKQIILLQKQNRNLIERLISYREVLLKTLGIELEFGIGNIVQDINLVKYSYQEAKSAIDFGSSKDGIEYIKHPNQLNTFNLLNLLPKDQLDNFVYNNLKNLAYPEDESLVELRKTLKTFLDFNCNITETANNLYIHRNTVKYRIEKCSEILEKDVTDAHNSLQLRICLSYLEDVQKELNL